MYKEFSSQNSNYFSDSSQPGNGISFHQKESNSSFQFCPSEKEFDYFQTLPHIT
jgi:hypothetical protein